MVHQRTVRAEVDPQDQSRVDEIMREYDRLQELFPRLAAAAQPEGGDLESAYSIRAYIRTLEQVADKMEEIDETMSGLIEEAQDLGWEGSD